MFPAASSSRDAPVYQSYGTVPGQDEFLYLNLTAEYVRRWQQRQAWQIGDPDVHAEL